MTPAYALKHVLPAALAPDTDRNERTWRLWKAKHPGFGDEIEPCNLCGKPFNVGLSALLKRDTCACEQS